MMIALVCPKCGMHTYHDSGDEHAKLERLRSENARLRAESERLTEQDRKLFNAVETFGRESAEIRAAVTTQRKDGE